ncbi:two-component sensor histidine kinase [Micrococcales bacterium 31B]|nr:two-component sensor histidine kinase [Micrococcales bacterium 31B]
MFRRLHRATRRARRPLRSTFGDSQRLLKSESLQRPPHQPGLLAQVSLMALGVAYSVIVWVTYTTSSRVDYADLGLLYRAGSDGLVAVGSVVGIALTGCLWYRYRYVRWLPFVVVAADVVSQNAVVSAACVFVVGTLGLSWRLVAVTCLAYAASLANVIGTRDNALISVVGIIVLYAVWAGIGLYTGARRDLLHSYQDRAARAENTQFSQAAQARTAERTRIAREMHDIVAHKISLIALHAGGLEVQAQVAPEKVQASAALIRQTATQALTELRGVLGVLRDADGGERAPQATWEDVLELVHSTQAAGVRVRLQNYIDPKYQVPSELPDALSRTVHRVLQESLTNVHKHATHTLVTITLAGSPGEALSVEVRNALPVGQITQLPGSGMGLAGLRERVELNGGTLRAGALDGYFVVHAEVPWTRDTLS